MTAPRSLLPVILTIGLLAAPLAAEARQPSKVPRVGVIRESSTAPSVAALTKFELVINLKTAKALRLDAGDLQRLDEALPRGAAAGLRYPEAQMNGVYL